MNFELYDCIEFLNVTRKVCMRKDQLEEDAGKEIIEKSLGHTNTQDCRKFEREVEVMAKDHQIGIDQLVQILTKPRSS